MSATSQLSAQSSLSELMDALSKDGFEHVDELTNLMQSCYLKTVGAVRLFASSLPTLVDNLFDVETRMGKLQSQGYLAALMVRFTRLKCDVDVL